MNSAAIDNVRAQNVAGQAGLGKQEQDMRRIEVADITNASLPISGALEIDGRMQPC